MDSNIKNKLFSFVKPNTVFIFSKSYCPYCDKAKELLSSIGVKYNSVEVDQDSSLDSDDAFITALNQHAKISTYPKIYIGEKCIGGYSDMYKLSQNMKLFTMLKNEGISYDDEGSYQI
jgi:glutaredoxin 3